jgi:hypothetical protein
MKNITLTVPEDAATWARIYTADCLGCAVIYSEYLSDGRCYFTTRVENPLC